MRENQNRVIRIQTSQEERGKSTVNGDPVTVYARRIDLQFYFSNLTELNSFPTGSHSHLVYPGRRERK